MVTEGGLSKVGGQDDTAIRKAGDAGAEDA